MIAFRSEPFGALELEVRDNVAPPRQHRDGHPPRPRRRLQRPRSSGGASSYLEEFSGAHARARQPVLVRSRTCTQGNVESFIGVAQVPIGLAGPLHVRGEHADGEFLIPMATTEGTLVASYNRGMKVLNESGGAICTVVEDCMQRAPVFIFESAREARDFKHWIDDHFDEIAAAAEATTSVGKLLYIDTYLAAKFAFLRFNFSTGDAAGQNMVGRATFAACSWILEQVDTVRRFYLESNFATDKKASQVNIMRTRGKRVVAEVTIPRRVLTSIMRVEPESLFYHSGVANVGSFLAGVNNNGLHSPNGITAMFIATGQDVANVAESSAGVVYVDLLPDQSLYLSITIPSLIVATLRRRHRPRHPARVPRAARLLRQRQGQQARRDRRRRGARGRDLAGVGHLVARLGVEPRAVRPQPLTAWAIRRVMKEVAACTVAERTSLAPGRAHPAAASSAP